jgi:hypothetical protein
VVPAVRRSVAWLEKRGCEFKKVSDPAAYERMRRISKRSLVLIRQASDGMVLPDFDVAQLENFVLKRTLLS